MTFEIFSLIVVYFCGSVLTGIIFRNSDDPENAVFFSIMWPVAAGIALLVLIPLLLAIPNTIVEKITGKDQRTNSETKSLINSILKSQSINESRLLALLGHKTKKHLYGMSKKNELSVLEILDKCVSFIGKNGMDAYNVLINGYVKMDHDDETTGVSLARWIRKNPHSKNWQSRTTEAMESMRRKND